MTVTQQRIGTRITERLSVSIHGPWDEATRDWAPRVAEAYNETYIFECRATPWERWAWEVFAKEELPPWDKYVRIYADGSWADNLPEELLPLLQDMADGSWAGDLPEDLLQRLQDIGKSGEDIKSGLALAERHPVDSQVWFACEILKSIDTIRKAMASHHFAWAVSEAMHFSELTATVSLKFNWEAAAMDGKRLLEGRPRAPKIPHNRGGKPSRSDRT